MNKRNKQRHPVIGGVVTPRPDPREASRALLQGKNIIVELRKELRKKIILPTVRDVIDVKESRERKDS